MQTQEEQIPEGQESEGVADWFLQCTDLALKYKSDRKALIEKENKNFNKLEWLNMNSYETGEEDEVEGLNYISFEKDGRKLCVMIEGDCLHIQNIEVPIKLRKKGVCTTFINKYLNSKRTKTLMFICVLSTNMRNLMKKLGFTQDEHNWYKNS
jgi:hypothetical protein